MNVAQYLGVIGEVLAIPLGAGGKGHPGVALWAKWIASLRKMNVGDTATPQGVMKCSSPEVGPMTPSALTHVDYARDFVVSERRDEVGN
jgi:hypothetical protein